MNYFCVEPLSVRYDAVKELQSIAVQTQRPEYSLRQKYLRNNCHLNKLPHNLSKA